MTVHQGNYSDSQLIRLAALGERFAAAQPAPVSRDQAAEGTGLPRHVTRFRPDELAADGLLDTDHKRRTGPGAGRPPKLYRRARDEIAVILPECHYDLAADLLARAVASAQQTGQPIRAALQAAARRTGANLVRGLNLDPLSGLLHSHPTSGFTARLDPASGRCRVTLTSASTSTAPRRR